VDARLIASTRLVVSLLAAVLATPACQDIRPLGPAARSPGLVQAAVGAPEQDEVGPFPKSGLFAVPSSGQTGAAGSADDPAIWVHPTDPSLSVIIGTNKNTSGGLHVFDLQGNQLQFVAGGQHNNVDVRYGFSLGGQSVDLVSADDRNNDQLDIYTINPATRQLTQVGAIQAGIEVYGYALYHSRPTGKFYAFVSSGDGVEQWELVDQGSSVGGRLVRTFPTTNLIEGMVADDELGDFYLAEEDHGIFKYGAEPDDPTTGRVTVDVVGSGTQLAADVEGLTIYYRAGGLGYLIASSQGNDRFVVYRREGANAHLGTFEIAAGAATSTDGIDVVNMTLGPLYPLGMFVAHDGGSRFRMVRWEAIANALGLAIHTQGYDVRGEACEGVASVGVTPASATIVEGATVQLGATPRDGGGAPVAGCSVTWSSGSVTVAAVTATGLVTGISNGPGQPSGMVLITAATEGVLGTATITVSDADPVAAFTVVPASPVAGQPAAFTDASTSVDGIQTWAWNFGDGGTGAGANPTHTFTSAGTYWVTLTVTEGDGDVAVVSQPVRVVVQPPVAIYFSVSSSATLSGVSVANEDIVAFDGTTFSLYFDGSDVGLGGFTLDAFAVISPTEILLSFTSAGTVGGISTDDSDVLKFTATALGPTTAGTFAMYFDASDVGLSTSDEDVDAIELLGNGHLLVSTTGSFSVTGASGADEDLIEFTPTSLGGVTAGSWSLYLDGSDVGLTSSDEDVDAVAVDASGRIYLSTTGAFAVTGRSGADEDVFLFTPATLGATTSGTFSTALFFTGSLFGLGGNDVVAIDLP